MGTSINLLALCTNLWKIIMYLRCSASTKSLLCAPQDHSKHKPVTTTALPRMARTRRHFLLSSYAATSSSILGFGEHCFQVASDDSNTSTRRTVEYPSPVEWARVCIHRNGRFGGFGERCMVVSESLISQMNLLGI